MTFEAFESIRLIDEIVIVERAHLDWMGLGVGVGVGMGIGMGIGMWIGLAWT